MGPQSYILKQILMSYVKNWRQICIHPLVSLVPKIELEIIMDVISLVVARPS